MVGTSNSKRMWPKPASYVKVLKNALELETNHLASKWAVIEAMGQGPCSQDPFIYPSSTKFHGHRSAAQAWPMGRAFGPVPSGARGAGGTDAEGRTDPWVPGRGPWTRL